MKDELYYLLINTKTALNKYGLSYRDLAAILGVSVDSVSRWLNNKHLPSELNMYKLHWFVYLALNRDLSVSPWMNISDLTFDSCPFGKYHSAPWYDGKNGSTPKPDTDHAEEFYDLSKDCDPFDFETDKNIVTANDFDDFDDLADLVANHDNKDALKDEYEVRDILIDSLSLYCCSYQEAIRRVEFLKKICDIHIDITKRFSDINFDEVMEYYVKVHNFSTFVKFINAFDTASYVDERFDMDHAKITLSHYTDPSLKTVNTKKVRSITIYKNYFEIKCDDDSVCRINNDAHFVINSSGSHKTDSFSFLMRVDNEYFALSLELG